MEISVTMEIPMGHRLMNHRGRCKNYHGHNYKVEVTIEATELENGMVADYSPFRRIVKDVLDQFDHAMVIQEGDGFADLFPNMRWIKLNQPPTAEVLACLWYRLVQEQIGTSRIQVTKVEVNETRDTKAIAILSMESKVEITGARLT